MGDDLYHYLECGLEHVYLVNGFDRIESKRGTSIAIHNVEGLHRVIGEQLCDKKNA